MNDDIGRKIELLMEIIFIIFIFLDSFLLFISVLLPLRPSGFMGIIYMDLLTSMLLFLGYAIKMRRQNKKIFVRRNWNGIISVTPFYFIGIILLGMSESSIILKVLVLIKTLALLMSARQVGRSVDEFVERSKLVYGFSFFVIVLLFSSVAFFVIESGVNPEVSTYEDSLWYVIQTITTVGYGDVVPATQWGRLIGVIAMVSAIGISSLLTAATTSSLMDKLRQERQEMAKNTVDYVKNIEKKINGLESIMATDKNVEDIKKDINDIKSEMNEIKKLLEKNE
ncbi:MAG: ion transporter [Methanobacteriaceae archaeon]|nr:ion transporter [Methanobacteriaceae archaeon]